MSSTVEEQDDSWVLVGEGMCCGKRRPQVNGHDVSPSQKSTGIIYDEVLSDLGSKPIHTKCWSPTVDGVLRSARAPDPNPTPDPRVEFPPESTATGLTFSAAGDVSSDPQPPTPAEDNIQLSPLTRANLGRYNMARLRGDIQAWVNGELTWLRDAAHGDQASDVPFGIGTTCRSNNGSLEFVFIPAQPSSFERDALEVGAVFGYLPHSQTYSPRIELDEA